MAKTEKKTPRLQKYLDSVDEAPKGSWFPGLCFIKSKRPLAIFFFRPFHG